MTDDSLSRHPTAEELSRLLDGDLSPDRVTEVEAHLSHCDSCRTAVEVDRRLGAELGAGVDVDPVEADPGRRETAIAAAMVAFDEEASPAVRAGAPARRRRGRAPIAAVAAAIVVAVGAGLGFAVAQLGGESSSGSGATSAQRLAGGNGNDGARNGASSPSAERLGFQPLVTIRPCAGLPAAARVILGAGGTRCVVVGGPYAALRPGMVAFSAVSTRARFATINLRPGSSSLLDAVKLMAGKVVAVVQVGNRRIAVGYVRVSRGLLVLRARSAADLSLVSRALQQT